MEKFSNTINRVLQHLGFGRPVPPARTGATSPDLDAGPRGEHVVATADRPGADSDDTRRSETPEPPSAPSRD